MTTLVEAGLSPFIVDVDAFALGNAYELNHSVPDDEKTVVLKLNHTLSFRTGIYPYSVMTSVFAPVDGMGRERFAPGKISVSAQEWCGHVYEQIHPKGDHFFSAGHSYFSSEGDSGRRVSTARKAATATW